MNSLPPAGTSWIIPNFDLAWRDQSCEWSLAPTRRGLPVTPKIIGVGSHAAFLFAAPAEALDALHVEFARQGGLRAHLWVDLFGPDGEVVRRATLDASAFRAGGMVRLLDLSGLAFQPGAKYRVELKPKSKVFWASLTILATPQPRGGSGFHRSIRRFRGDRTPVYGAASPVDAGHLVAFPPGASLATTRPVLDLLARAFPGERFAGSVIGDRANFWRQASGARTVAFANVHATARALGEDYDSLCFELNRLGVTTLAIDTETRQPSPLSGGPLSQVARAAIEEQQRCAFILRDAPQMILASAERPMEPLAAGPAPGDPGILALLAERMERGRWPKVAVVSVLYKKAGIVGQFLAHVRDQTYPGPITIVLVDDCSPENDVEEAERFAAGLTAAGRTDRSVKVIRNPSNAGNCQSRMNGLAAEDADVYVVMDCDCLINPDFVAAHVFEHGHPEVDVVIGPLNIESLDRDPAALVRELDADPARIAAEAEPQDSIQNDGFLNCITRNFSIKKAMIPVEGLFDGDFAYSAKPDSGFGWEDVEMGYRLYAAGARIRYTGRAFCVHATHPSSASEQAKARGSMRNFERLFVKHPDLALVGRRWAVDTYDKIVDWADRAELEPDEARRSLDARFADVRRWQAPLVSVQRGRRRRLKVLSYRWHVPHQYELYKLPHDFTLATHVGENGMVDAWAYEQRPLRSNVRLRPACEIDPADYDVAILHFDENVLAPELCNNVIPASWGDPFLWLLDTPLPKAAICHGTAQFVGQYGADSQRKAEFVLHEDERRRLVDILAGVGARVVCNSHQAQAEWGFADSRVIWHGFDPQEFPAGRGDLDVLALGGDPHRPHYRGAWEEKEVEALLDPGIRVETARHFGGALEMRGTNAYASARFRAYVERIGRFKAYLNTTLRSPMPRSRGEAMMTGVAPVCLNNHDVSMFIDNGLNGFYSDEPAELADFLNHLCRNEAVSRRLSQAARRTALDVFNHDRYLTAWTGLLDEISS